MKNLFTPPDGPGIWLGCKKNGAKIVPTVSPGGLLCIVHGGMKKLGFSTISLHLENDKDMVIQWKMNRNAHAILHSAISNDFDSAITKILRSHSKMVQDRVMGGDSYNWSGIDEMPNFVKDESFQKRFN